MIAFIFAILLAQVPPEPETTPSPGVSSSPSAAPSAAPSSNASVIDPGRVGIPQGPRRMPMDVPSLSPGDVFIRNSGSTNTAGYALVVHKDFTASVAGTQKPVGPAQAKWLYAKLDAAKPLTSIGAAHCMKSASFGSVTTITYDGETTPDLSCPGGPESRELMRTIGVIVAQLGISTRPGSRLMRNL